jgi:diaminopimelate epimerase
MHISKYNASGNDFVIFHTFKKADRSELAKVLCHRQNGIGADGLIVLVPHESLDYEWEFYNSDGSLADMCGNGSRATAHYAVKNGLADVKHSFLSGAGEISCEVDGDLGEVELTKPKELKKKFSDEGREWQFFDTGVPHLVTFVDDLEEYSKELASLMRHRYNANVNFCKVDGDVLRVRTYERGVEDETLACGTGMAACFYSAFINSDVKDTTKVYPTSGEELILSFRNGSIFFKGRVERVFETCV